MPHIDAPLGLPTCLWQLAGLCLLLPWFLGLAEAGGPEAQQPGGLSWAVRLHSREGEQEEKTMQRRADALAQAAGLVNTGRIGELRGHYLFVQPAGHRPAMDVEAARQQAEAVLAGHADVRWHSEQRLLRRTKRSIYFNDPKYPQQWHLVSPALPWPVAKGTVPSEPLFFGGEGRGMLTISLLSCYHRWHLQTGLRVCPWSIPCLVSVRSTVVNQLSVEAL